MEDSGGPEKDLKISSSGSEKESLGKCSGAWMTAKEVEAGLAATDVLAVWWWLEERQRVDAGHFVKIVEVSSLTVDSQRS